MLSNRDTGGLHGLESSQPPGTAAGRLLSRFMSKDAGLKISPITESRGSFGCFCEHADVRLDLPHASLWRQTQRSEGCAHVSGRDPEGVGAGEGAAATGLATRVRSG